MVLEGEDSNSDFDNKKKKIKKCLEGSRAVVGMLMVQLFGTGLQLLSRVILSQGTFICALLAYRNVVGALTVAPFAFFFERGKGKELGRVVAFWLFMNALTGVIMAMGLFYYGLRDTTATYATNFLNLIPIATFVFSTIIGIEKLRLGTKGGKVKTMGAIVCLAGALTIALYKGRSFYVLHHGAHHQPDHVIIQNYKHNWTRGTIFLICSIVSYAMWFIVQVKLFKAFPYKYWAIMLTCTIASVQATVIGLCLDRKKSSWRLDWNLQLLTIFYSGILATGASYVLISWAVANRGPTYPSMFNPLALIFVAITEAFFLGEAVTVGSLVGMSLIIVGLYLFLWGKNKELKSMAMTKSAASEESIVATDRSAGTPSAIIAMSTATPTDSDAHVVNGHDNRQREVVGLT